MNKLTIGEAVKWAVAQLATSSESAQIDAEVLLLHCLGKARSFIYSWPERPLSEEQQRQFEALVGRRAKGTPVAHILGEREFWSLPFMVNDSTLIPRADTEILVETALNLNLPAATQALDLGTGTGAIALALAHERPQWQMTAVDKVADAVALAQANRERLKLPQVEILQSDWFSAVSGRKFDLIVSNPPYIAEADEHLDAGDVRFEPRSALTAANDGFADLFHIAEHARQYLHQGGYILLEHGYTQGPTVRAELQRLGYQNVATVRDFGSNERCSLGTWLG
ncbi:peptide chain release factor N(5)-glutamine methyltransferase [Shewanella avicenniae]|uniref:Release factor glutamine methyltransferase n=1 Tax=Shewanella avicenniae TaxID=2814294 RepID=A0ABX7QT15_9GAMM|nr:peptide chain release factor N(5)-glutamine methyltransferase [Shewanella avicenniae]QSX34619.1 peptide chain release factor N(5)-glutamine methyltransferase [Shewanella avicenniae]